MNDEFTLLADENVPAPSVEPDAQLCGDDAALVMQAFMSEDVDASAVFENLPAMMPVGRPQAGESIGQSVQERFRVPTAWTALIDNAVKSGGFANKSDYFRSLVARDVFSHMQQS